MSGGPPLKVKLSTRMTTWIVGLGIGLWIVPISLAEELPLVASAKLLRISSPTTNQAGPMMGTPQQQVIASLPQTKMPQYQVASSVHSDLADDGVLHWRLRVGERTVKIETALRIDQKPFQFSRRDALARVLTTSTDEVSQAEAKQGPPFTLATTPSELLRRYALATQRDLASIDIAEARRLVSEMLLGPELLMVKSRFQAFRAQQRPYFAVLDRDRDGVLSADEIQSAEISFIQCDTNRNDIVEIEEIEEAAKYPRQKTQADDAISLGNVDATSEPFELMSSNDLISFEPELVFEIDFSSTDPGGSSLTLVRAEPSLEAECSVNGHQIDVHLDQRLVTFGIIQSEQEPGQDQISVGAVVDGYPLVLAGDPNADGRITIRERRECATRLLAYDTDDDGQIGSDEAHSPLRVCFGLGPIVHMELARLRDPPMPTVKPVLIESPEWFARMDSNTDGDLSRREFSGSDEQFRQLDTDDDQLISSTEANRTP